MKASTSYKTGTGSQSGTKCASVVWQGTIELHHHELSTVHTHGPWIHADQSGVDRDLWAEWFLAELPADLETKGP